MQHPKSQGLQCCDTCPSYVCGVSQRVAPRLFGGALNSYDKHMTKRTGQELCRRCSHGREYHIPDCRFETKARPYCDRLCLRFISSEEQTKQNPPTRNKLEES